MTATTTRPKPPARVKCPHCTYSGEPGSSIAGHVAMAHPDVPIDTVAPKRSARNGESAESTPAPAGTPSLSGAGSLDGATLAEIPLELVDVGDNVRVTLEAIDELAASIAEHGVLQPVKATLLPSGRYSLLWGQRRVLAARKAGLATIPALVYADEPDDRPIEQLVENLHRADLNPIDRARAMRAVVDAGVSQADLARKLELATRIVEHKRADKERREAIAQRVAALRARIRIALDDVPIPVVILAHADAWSLPKLIENAATADPAEIRDLVADSMASRLDASWVYNDRQKSVEASLEAVIALLPEPVA